MSITPAQFNKLITKDEHQELEKKVDKIGSNVEKLVSSADYIVNKMDIIETELVSNQAAHDRFEKRIARLEVHAGIKSI